MPPGAAAGGLRFPTPAIVNHRCDAERRTRAEACGDDWPAAADILLAARKWPHNLVATESKLQNRHRSLVS